MGWAVSQREAGVEKQVWEGPRCRPRANWKCRALFKTAGKLGH